MFADKALTMEWVGMLMAAGMNGDLAVTWINAAQQVFQENIAHSDQFLRKVAMDYSLDHLYLRPNKLAGMKAEDFIGFDDDHTNLFTEYVLE